MLHYEPDAVDRVRLDGIVRLLDAENGSFADFRVKDRPFVGGFEPAFDEEEDDPQAFYAAFGFRPHGSITVGAMCNSPVDHRVLGEIGLQLAQEFGGVIAFNGLLGVGRGLPGRLVTLGSHFSDAKFLRAWLEHPAFHLCK